MNKCHWFENSLLALEKNIMISSQRILATKRIALADVNSQIINQTRTLLAHKKESINLAKTEVINSTNRLISKRREDAASYHHAVVSSSFRIISNHRHELTKISSLLTTKPLSLVAIKKNNLNNEREKIMGSTKRYLSLQSGYVGHFDTLFRHFNVDKILQKGFAIIRKNGQVISDPAQIHINDNINIQLKDSLIDTKVTNKRNGTGSNL